MGKQELQKDTQSDICQIIERNIKHEVFCMPDEVKEKFVLKRLKSTLQAYVEVNEGEVEDRLVTLLGENQSEIIDDLIETYLYHKITDGLFDGPYVKGD